MASRLVTDFPLPHDLAAFRAAYYIPTFSKFNGSTVPAVQWLSERTSGIGRYSTFLAGIKIICAARDLSNPPEEFQWDGVWFGHPGTELVDQYAGTALFRELLEAGEMSPEQIEAVFEEDVRVFTETRREFLLY